MYLAGKYTATFPTQMSSGLTHSNSGYPLLKTTGCKRCFKRITFIWLLTDHKHELPAC